METFIVINQELLTFIVALGIIEVVGGVQMIKNFLKKKDEDLNPKQLALSALILSIACGGISASFLLGVPAVWITMFHIIALIITATQIGYDTIAKLILRFFDAFASKLVAKVEQPAA